MILLCDNYKFLNQDCLSDLCIFYLQLFTEQAPVGHFPAFVGGGVVGVSVVGVLVPGKKIRDLSHTIPISLTPHALLSE